MPRIGKDIQSPKGECNPRAYYSKEKTHKHLHETVLPHEHLARPHQSANENDDANRRDWLEAESMAECADNAYQSANTDEVHADFPPNIDYKANDLRYYTSNEYASEEVGCLNPREKYHACNVAEQCHYILYMSVLTQVEHPLAEVLSLSEDV